MNLFSASPTSVHHLLTMKLEKKMKEISEKEEKKHGKIKDDRA